MKVIVPCCGRSSRFPGQPPKWTLPSHDGRPMIWLAVAGLELSLDDLMVTILREHEEKYGISRRPGGSVRPSDRSGDSRRAHCAASRKPWPARSRRPDLGEPFLVKDSDGSFKLDELGQADNYVCVESLNNFDSIVPRSKSYVQVDADEHITKIREKVVISDLFNVGGYYFTSPERFLELLRAAVEAIRASHREIYLSDVIAEMIRDGIPFRGPAHRRLPGLGHRARMAAGAAGRRKAFFVLARRFRLRAGFAVLFAPVCRRQVAPQGRRSRAGDCR